MDNARKTGSKSKKYSKIFTLSAKDILILSVFIIVITAFAIHFFINYKKVAPFKAPVVGVDGTSVSMEYFLKRIVISGEPPMSMLQTLMDEQILKNVVSKPPYNILINEDDLDLFLRDIAQRGEVSLDDNEYSEWYRQQLNESRLTESEYRDLARVNMLKVRLKKYLSERVPTVAPQVFVNMILIGDPSVGNRIKEQHDSGEDFAALSQEYSTDPNLQQNNGKLGWFPRGALHPALETSAFQLPIGKSSDLIQLNEQTYAIIMISEKVAARDINEESMKSLRSRVLDDWFAKEYKNHELNFYGLYGGAYDSATDAWVREQIEHRQSETQ